MAQTITGSAYLRSIDSAKGRVREIDISGVIRVQDATLVGRLPVQIRRRKLGAVLQDVIEPRYRLTEIVTRRSKTGRLAPLMILQSSYPLWRREAPRPFALYGGAKLRAPLRF